MQKKPVESQLALPNAGCDPRQLTFAFPFSPFLLISFISLHHLFQFTISFLCMPFRPCCKAVDPQRVLLPRAKADLGLEAETRLLSSVSLIS